MKNENSDEKVTSIKPVNQSRGANRMQLAEPLHKNDLITAAVDLKGRGAGKTDVNRLQISLTDRDPAVIRATPSSFTLHLHTKTTGNRYGGARGLLKWKINGHKHSL